jgi:hypothetical protein
VGVNAKLNSNEQQFDLEAQQRILELAIRFDANRNAMATGSELVQAGLELGLSKASIDQAIEAYMHQKPTNRASEEPKKTWNFSACLVLQTVFTILVCFQMLDFPGHTLGYFAGPAAFLLAFVTGTQTYNSGKLLGKVLSNHLLSPVLAGIAALIIQVTIRPWFTFNIPSVLGCAIIGVCLILISMLGAIVKRQGLDPVESLFRRVRRPHVS